LINNSPSVGNGIGAAITEKLLGPPGLFKPTKRILFGKNCIDFSFISLLTVVSNAFSKKKLALWQKIWSKLKITLTEMRYLTTNMMSKYKINLKDSFGGIYEHS
jgi:hypothetical protein